MVICAACLDYHALGSCPLKRAGAEYCNICGIAHYGRARVCPHISSETQVRAMLAALKQSSESGELVKEARRYLVGVKGTLVQKKKKDLEKARANETRPTAVGPRALPWDSHHQSAGP